MMFLSENATTADLKVDLMKVIAQQELLTQNIENITMNPPAFLFDRDERWSNLSAYADKWEHLGKNLQELAENLDNG